MSDNQRRPSSSFTPVLDDAAIAAAAARIAAVFRPTPLLHAPGRGAFLKLENLQTTGAYKVRGAYNAVAARWERGERRPLVCASAGNHGLGVAWAARHFGLPATIVVPGDAPATKVRGCRALGARVVVGGDTVEQCLAQAQILCAAGDAGLVHPFDDLEVIAGQATLAVELLPFRPDVVVVPIGGGGLAAGVGTVFKRLGIRVVGVQVAGIDGFRRAWLGQPSVPMPPPTRAATNAPTMTTLADGLRVACPGRLTVPLCRDLLDDIVLVSEEEIADAVASLALVEKVVAEGAGAAAVAALPVIAGARKVAVVSGGNIDAAVLARLATRAAA
ncbi:MAG: threonine dehydratase [Myxococcales bacterium]|nr:threonine dehydratase [Myxococcales bacterium]